MFSGGQRLGRILATVLGSGLITSHHPHFFFHPVRDGLVCGLPCLLPDIEWRKIWRIYDAYFSI